jgi:hypothetical protein
VAGVYGQGWKFTCVGHAPNLSKPDSFDFMCKYLHGAWPTYLLFMPIHLSPEGLSVLGICTVILALDSQNNYFLLIENSLILDNTST